jgi:hypothetical protein
MPQDDRGAKYLPIGTPTNHILVDSTAVGVLHCQLRSDVVRSRVCFRY